MRHPPAGIQREDPVHRRCGVGRAHRDRRAPASRAERGVRRLRGGRRHPVHPRGGVRGRAAGGLRSGHASGLGRPAAGRHDALGGCRHRARTGAGLRRSPLAARFTLRDLTLVRRIEREGDAVTGVTVEDLRTGESSFVPADAVVVAADAFRSPQLLWASGIRPQGARALPHRASGRDLDGRTRSGADEPLHERGGTGRGAGAAREERGGSRSRRSTASRSRNPTIPSRFR